MLSPYAKVPSRSAKRMYGVKWKTSPAERAMIQAPVPEQRPLMMTISCGSFAESFRVQLFSKPQQRQASITSSEPFEKRIPEAPSRERRKLAALTRMMAIQSFGEIASLKISSAMRLVVTISKLLSSDALAAVVNDIPDIRHIGAAMSRRTMPIV